MMMSSKKKSSLTSKSSKAANNMYGMAPPVPPRPVMAALKIPKKSLFKEQVCSPPPKPSPNNSMQQVNQKYLRVPSNGLYISNSCDNVHKMSRQPYPLNENVYGSSHIILGQHIHNESSHKSGMLFLKSSPSMKLSKNLGLKQNFVGSQPDINNYQHHVRGSWNPESYPERKHYLKEKVDYSNHAYFNGYDHYDPRYLNSYHHKNTLPVPCYPPRKIYSTNSSSSSRSSSKSKSSTNYSSSHELNSNMYTNFTFNQCTFQAEDYNYNKSKPPRTNSSLETKSYKPRLKKETKESDHDPISNFSKLFPLSAKMASLHGLPPLPKSLSGINLSSDALPKNPKLQNDTQPRASSSSCVPHANEEKKGRSLPTPPASLSQNNPTPINYTPSSSRKPVSLDAKLTILRQEMFGLRQLDLSLLSQLWSLNESIQEFRQLQESMSIPSPSDDGEDPDELLYSNLPPMSGRVYRKMRRNADDSSSSSSSVDYGKV